MTTIALRDGYLAADRACNNDGTRVGYRCKIRRVEGGRIAMTGYLSTCLAIVEWIEGGRKGKAPIEADEENTGAVIFVPDEGDATLIEKGQECPLPDAPYHAFGVGRDVALGAMHKGATAEEAVAAGIAHNLATDGGPDVLPPKEAK